MGIGYTLDILMCVAMGVDMFDCVYPSRTARFGNALTTYGIQHIHTSTMACTHHACDALQEC